VNSNLTGEVGALSQECPPKLAEEASSPSRETLRRAPPVVLQSRSGLLNAKAGFLAVAPPLYGKCQLNVNCFTTGDRQASVFLQADRDRIVGSGRNPADGIRKMPAR
jgi:hypothetical protein